MVYNKVKRNLEKAAGIVGVVVSSIMVLALCIAAIVCFVYANTISYEIIGYDSWGMPIMTTIAKESFIATGFWCLVLFALELVNLIMCAKTIKTPVQEDGTIKPRTGIRVCAVVFSFLCGNLISAGLMIAVLCLKDVKEIKAKQVNQTIVHSEPTQLVSKATIKQTNENRSYNFNAQTNENLEFCEKLSELKHLKSLGVVDELTFKKCVNKIVDDFLKVN